MGDGDPPDDATHVRIHDSVTDISMSLFYEHPNIVELFCPENVKEIEGPFCANCPRLRQVVMLAVEKLEVCTFSYCESLEYVECNHLEDIGGYAFFKCKSLRGMDLPSARIVGGLTFSECEAMKEVKFGKNLESIEGRAFYKCPSLERITIPLKNDLFDNDNIFQECENLRHVHLVEEEILHEIVATLHLERWRNDMKNIIDSIEHFLPLSSPGIWDHNGSDSGGKVIVIDHWIRSILRKIIHYKEQHCQILKETAIILKSVFPHEIVVNHVLPLLELPSYSFDGEDNDNEMDNVINDLEMMMMTTAHF